MSLEKEINYYFLSFNYPFNLFCNRADGHEIKHLFACDMIVITAMSLRQKNLRKYFNRQRV